MCMSKKVQFSTTLWKVDFKCSSRQWSRTLAKSYKRSFPSFSPLWPEAKMNSNLLPNLKYSHKWHTWSKKIHKVTVEKETETMISYSYPHPNRPPPLPPSYKESEEGLTIQVDIFLLAPSLKICVVLYEMNLRDLQNIDRVGLPDVWWKLLLEIRYCSILRPNIGPVSNSVRFQVSNPLKVISTIFDIQIMFRLHLFQSFKCL